MIAFVQPFGLHSPGGGPRILRSLLEDAPVPFVSVCTALRPPDTFDAERELHLPMRPYLGRIEHTRLAWPLSALTLAWGSSFKRKLGTLFDEQGVTGVHAIPHGLDFWYAFEAARERGLPYVLNVHDDMTYNLHDRVYLPLAMNRLATVWRDANARVVISEAMGEAYSKRYGRQPYEVITDGLPQTQLASSPRPRVKNRLNVYFMGSVHISYQQNFQSLLDALNLLSERQPDVDIRLKIRGGLPFDLTPGAVSLDMLGWGTQADIEKDLESVDLLYLPLPFSPEHSAFVQFSLSTKLVTYLGSGFPILYHGPKDAAAARLLETNHAGLLAYTDAPERLAALLINLDESRLEAAAAGALDLAQYQFMLDDQRRRFWHTVRPTAPVMLSGTVSA